ncbi:sigma-54-dependent Fis family transcriptional regulator [Pseudoxanthomonas kalamensis DSM 18571]|nr:sigma-54-dependent Fis family transcriptional regulator [Pseudoxanthomonas kalamensis DSM 18571]
MAPEMQRLIEQFNLRSHLRFDLGAGRIWLDENRMLLTHARAMGALRAELIRVLGTRRARILMLRMGFISGSIDAEVALKLHDGGDNYDVFRLGPELHGFEGIVKSTITDAKIDWENGSFFGEVDLKDSWEAEAHLNAFGVGDDAACWSVMGYATGFVTRYFNRFIVFKETQCVCCGDDTCTIVGKPAEAWGEDVYSDYFGENDSDDPMRAMEEELAQLRGRSREQIPAGDLVGMAPSFRAAFDLLSKAAASPITVLLLGETGVGKEMFARWLHDHGPRSDAPFVAVNCAAIPHDLIESELFGVQKGAYTGADASRAGRFERANGGTLFLDEVGDLSPAAQVKLLRVLQTGEVERLGDDRSRKVDVRLIAATNVDLQQAIAMGRFRADLYYRLATYPVTIPPLQERRSDIPMLAASLLEKYQEAYGKKVQGISERGMHALLAHSWPGNVRELENMIERAVLLAPPGGLVEIDHLFASGAPREETGAELDSSGALGNEREARLSRLYDELLEDGFDLERHEARLLALAMQRSGGNMTHAARSLGITRRQLSYRLKQGTGGEASSS